MDSNSILKCMSKTVQFYVDMDKMKLHWSHNIPKTFQNLWGKYLDKLMHEVQHLKKAEIKKYSNIHQYINFKLKDNNRNGFIKLWHVHLSELLSSGLHSGIRVTLLKVFTVTIRPKFWMMDKFRVAPKINALSS